MRQLLISLIIASIVGCSTSERPQSQAVSKAELQSKPLKSPVDLRTAILTLPIDAVAGMSEQGRIGTLRSPVFDLKITERRLDLFDDNCYSDIDADSMLFLRLFEDEQGRTIAASHAARPYADVGKPSEKNTLIYRLENGVWHDITGDVIPAEIPRDWYFRFDDSGANISCGPYFDRSKSDRTRKGFDFGDVTYFMEWQNGRFKAKRESHISGVPNNRH